MHPGGAENLRIGIGNQGRRRRITGLQGAQNGQGRNRLARQIGCDIGSNHRQPRHPDVEPLPRRACRQKFIFGDRAQAEVDACGAGVAKMGGAG